MHTREQLSSLIDRYIAQLELPARPERLYDPIRYSLEGGGKRLRPLVLLMTCDALGGEVADALPLAAAVEVFHNFTLLHDDIMDNAPVRRGKPAVHARWSANTAILSGDVMLIYAYRLLAMAGPGVLDEFNRMGTEVCEGQQHDMDFEGRDMVCEGEYMEMIALKTAALIARAVKMGAMAAGASAENCGRLYRFGYELGLAFQLQDDLLDSYSDDPSFGKKVGGDIIEGKKSFLTVTAMRLGSDEVRSRLSALLADRAMDDAGKVARVRAIYDTLGVRQVTGGRIREHILLAVEALESVEAPAGRLAPLRELALSLLDRKK